MEPPQRKEEPKPQAVVKELEVQTIVQENRLMGHRAAREDATQLVLQFKRQLQEAALAIEKKTETQQSRIDFLTRTLNSSQKEKERLYSKLRQLNSECEAQKDKFEQQVENLQYQAKEVENNYVSKIQAALHQLRGLREFQEHKHQMDERMRNLGQLIAKERKERTAELAQIHKKLIAQREYYERQLASNLAEADEYATRFEDLDLDRATTKILHETEQRREALKSENALTVEVIKRNDQLRHQVQDLEQQRRVLEESEKNLTTQAVDLKAKLDDTNKKLQESSDLAQSRLEQLKHQLHNRISELDGKLEQEKKNTENLKRELALAQKQFSNAEAQRDERLKKDTNLLGVMNEAAIFILTSLELQEKDPSKDEITAHSSALNAVIRKISNVSQDLTGVQQKPVDPIQNQGIQTELPMKKFVASGKPDNAAKIRSLKQQMTTKQTEDFRKSPEYQRIFGKDAGNAAATAAKAKILRIHRNNK